MALKPYTPIYDTDYDGYENRMAELQGHILMRDGLQHYATIGYFLQWFAAAEQGVDFLLRWGAGIDDLGTYETIIKGLPPRSKCERLRSICRDRKVRLGPNLDKRLNHFADRVCAIRNSIAHSFMIHGAETEWIEFFTIGEVPRMSKGAPRARYRMRTLELFEHGAWLQRFAIDLQRELLVPAPRLAVLEIAAPVSGLPKAQGPGSQPKATRASGRKRARTPASTRPAKKRKPKAKK